MEHTVVGNYIIGFESVELVLREGDGGEFYFCPEPGAIPRIKLGADCHHFGELLATLIHEVGELSMCRLGLRYIASEDMSNDHSGYLFMMNHPQFSDLCNRIAEGLVNCQKDLKKAYKVWIKARAKEAKALDVEKTIAEAKVVDRVAQYCKVSNR